MDTRIELIQRALAAEDGVEITIEGQDISDIQDALGDDPSVEEIEEHLEGSDEPERDLQGFDAVMDVIEQAESEGFDPSEQTAADLMAFVQESLDLDDEAMQAMQNAADAYLETEEAESLDAVSAEGLRDFVAEQTDGEEEEEEADGGEEEEGDDDVMEELSELREEVRELREKDAEKEKRIEELENEPVEKREFGSSDDSDGEETGAMPVKSGLSRDGGYVTR